MAVGSEENNKGREKQVGTPAETVVVAAAVRVASAVVAAAAAVVAAAAAVGRRGGGGGSPRPCLRLQKGFFSYRLSKHQPSAVLGSTTHA